ncbi:MAG: S1C family serine protease [Lachnospiraceae bacterium]
MPEINGPEKNPSDKNRFIREKVVRQPMSKRQIAKRLLMLFCVAVMFGVIAAVSFVVTKPFAQRYLGEESASESAPVTIPRDEPETPAPAEPMTEPDTEETEPIEDVLQTVMEDYEFTIDDLNTLYGSLRSVCQMVDYGIVDVHSVKHEKDWFDNPMESTGTYAGAVIASTREELLILTTVGAVEDVDSIQVTFFDGSSVSGEKKQADSVTGMAVVSVKSADLEMETRNQIQILELGNSYSVKQGDMLIAVGSPAGVIRSTDYGFVSYIQKNVQAMDGSTRLFYTSTMGNASLGTFLVNTSGQVIGWVTDAYQQEESTDRTTVMAISDYKCVLEMMSNGIAVPYVGIRGQEVNAEMMQDGLPSGIYVVSVQSGSPAYDSGIQNGDIVTMVGDKAVSTVKEYQSAVEALEPGTEVILTVQRNGREEYKTIEYPVKIGAR